MDLVEEIKNKLNILDMVRDFGLTVTRNNFISSIYKEERNPSLKLYPKTNSYYDFSTGKGGDVINFYADKKNIDLKTAIKELGTEHNIEAIDKKSKPRTKNAASPKKVIYKLNKSEQEYFCELTGYLEYYQNLKRNEAEEEAYNQIINDRIKKQKFIFESFAEYCNGVDEAELEYLTGPKRGLTKETIEYFKLFSIKDTNKAIQFLKENFILDDLKLAGLFNEQGRFVFWKHRIIIPFIEENEIVYLRGRYFERGKDEPESCGKYIGLSNAAGNLGSKRLYNRDVLEQMKEDSELMICEGEFDTMIVSQMGYKAVGIPGVTNFPKSEIESLERFSIYLAFDSDEPGQKAMEHIAKLFKKQILGIKLKKYKDITEYIIDATKN